MCFHIRQFLFTCVLDGGTLRAINWNTRHGVSAVIGRYGKELKWN